MAGWVRFLPRSHGLCALVVLLVFLSCGLPHAKAAVVVDLEDLPLEPESFYNGSDGAGGFISRGAFFNNTYTDFGGGYYAWSGWSYSNITDNSTPGFENQFSAIPGGGAQGSSNYGVAYTLTPGEAYLELPPGTWPVSMLITNTTYAYHTIRDGDAFAEPFGGPTGDEPDYFLLMITGLDEQGSPLGSVEFYLADFRFNDNELDYIVNTWSELELSGLAGARTLSFALESSDVGPYGMNTPAYFAIDNLCIVPEPAGLGLLAVASLALLRRRSSFLPGKSKDIARRGPGPTRRQGGVNSGAGPSWAILCLAVVAVASRTCADTPFASVMIDYSPAPGQFVNDDHFHDPTVALGPPAAGGFSEPGMSSLVTLGGFGGSITLAFEETVEDHPLNPFGTDAIVFGNAFWAGDDPNAHWAECATIEISLDVNSNGWPDGPPQEPWYLVPGSHIDDPAGQLTVVTWDDDVDDETYPPDYPWWIPPDDAGTWTTQGYALPDDMFGPLVVMNPSGDPEQEGIFGYAEYSPTLKLGDLDGDNVVDDPEISPEDFYTVPDDPLGVGITSGSGGGDAFDIAWAIDPTTGEPAGLTGFDFIRLTSAVNVVSDVFGEKSAEIDAVADVAPDPFGDCDSDGDIDLADAACMQNCFELLITHDDPCEVMDRNGDEVIDGADVAAFIMRLTGPK